MCWFGAGEEMCGRRVRKKYRHGSLPSMRHQKVLLRKVLSQLRSKGWGGQAQRPGRCKGASGGGPPVCRGLEPWKSQTRLKNWTVFRMAGAQKMKWLILKEVTLYKRRTREATSAKTWEEQERSTPSFFLFFFFSLNAVTCRQLNESQLAAIASTVCTSVPWSALPVQTLICSSLLPHCSGQGIVNNLAKQTTGSFFKNLS